MITFSELSLPLSISMKNPELQDAEELETNTIVHTAMSGAIRTYRRTPAVICLKLSFSELSRTKAMELRNFIIETAGMELQFVDHHSFTWRGRLLNEDLDITTDGRGPGKDGVRREGSSVVLEFEGVRV